MKDVRSDEKRARLVGVGLDGDDDHRRMTCGEEFHLLGGSEETHERMVGTAIRFTEKVKDRGKTLGELETREFRDLLEESMEE